MEARLFFAGNSTPVFNNVFLLARPGTLYLLFVENAAKIEIICCWFYDDLIEFADSLKECQKIFDARPKSNMEEKYFVINHELF